MSDTLNHIKANAIGYLIPVLAGAVGLGFLAIMDARHEPRGSAEEASLTTELRAIKREKRKLENYLELSPNSEYTASRKKEIADLEDEADEINRQLDKLR